MKIIITKLIVALLFSCQLVISQTQITEVKYQVKDNKPSLVDSIVFSYNSSGQLSEARFNNSEPISSKTYLYNAAGKLTEEKHYKYTDLRNTYKYEYDKSGRLTKEKCYDSNNKLMFTNTLKYDSKGNMIRKKSDISTGIRIDNSYDSQNRNYKSIVSGNSRNQKEIEYLYDDKSRIQQETIFQSLKNSKKGKRYQQSKIRYVYDDTGRLTEKHNYLTEDVIEKFKYTYGDNGKLAKWEKLSPQGKLEFIVEYRYE